MEYKCKQQLVYRLTAIIVLLVIVFSFVLILNSCNDKKVARVIVIAGQSNCEGVSKVEALKNNLDEKTFARYEKGFDKIKLIRPSTNVRIDEFIPVRLGMGSTEESFGIEIGIADYLSEKYSNEEFYIVKNARGGTSIDLWWDEGIRWDSAVSYYSVLVDDINRAIFLLESEGKRVVLEAFCWMQGESDASSIDKVNQYEARLRSMVSDFREQFAAYNENEIRFVDGAISDYPNERPYYYVELNNIKKKFSLNSEYNFYIDTIDMGLTKNLEPSGNPDLWHYDSLSMIMLGKSFGKLSINS